ncbi:SNF2 family N-terminal domain-containing protein [Hysterangium stoloniferum]|nr:SNF2 family N-terminal domain-containing protein [Hysterangium stoloniferum]
MAPISIHGAAPGFWPLDELIPSLKKPKKLDQAQAAKRVMALEESQRRVWLNIARKDVVRVYKYHATGYAVKSGHHKRLASMAASQARKSSTRTTKSTKDVQTRAKRLMREMLVFWKKNEREERDIRKRAEKEAVDRAKEEEEKREAARQARKLEFLISQTELYSHFVGNKLKNATNGDTPVIHTKIPQGAEAPSLEPLDELDFDNEDQTNLHRHAARNAQGAIQLAKERAQAFDAQTALDRKINEDQIHPAVKEHTKYNDGEVEGRASVLGETSTSAPIVDLDSDELNFQNPTSMKEMTIAQPRMLMAQLKEYQLKGLNWLATLYEQGINGILADEMGLGKTVQSISLLAYLAETHDIWGPFLVIAPASTLHNWQQEITRFVPSLKALPYWGNVKDRATLRKFWNKKQISYNQDAPFHVLITSYPLIVQDDKYFQRVKWQYMILDEAQAIKSSSSARWKTLLNFQCRNRLLLTGTPVQNSMQELWALLHFIMPSLFDSHDEFSEWFSKDIENAAENKGGKLNEHQLRRLHMILKPFMLRRVKRHVQNELSEKIELDIYCDMSPRQRSLYRGLRANISVAELLQKAANLGDADSAMSLMNLVMQFRKVCNHPELFERSDVVAPFSFCTFGRSGSLIREGDFLDCPYSAENPIKSLLPHLFFHSSGLLEIPGEHARAGFETHWFKNILSIWSTDSIFRSLIHIYSGSTFSFLHLLNSSPQEIHATVTAEPLCRMLAAAQEEAHWRNDAAIYTDAEFACSTTPIGLLPPRLSAYLAIADGLPALDAIGLELFSTSYLSRPDIRWRSESVVAPPIMVEYSSRVFFDRAANKGSYPLISLALYGLTDSQAFDGSLVDRFHTILPGLPPLGLFRCSPGYQIPWSPMQVPEGKRLIYDSTKLARLDALLQELKAGDHRVLIYFQMTKMMDLMEEYLVYRQYKYLRLDGSSKLEDRRDMVLDWQTRPEIFIFLLSTRAGGLGINLTAADTVIFYDHDWNPSNDAQAMDRAHRLGQTRQVTVYRLITRGTIDERIVQLARVKKDVQDIVVGNKQFTEATKPSEIVSLLLNDEELANLGNAPSTVDASTTKVSERRAGKQPEDARNSSGVRDLWNEEGDDFFGQPNPAPVPALGVDIEDDMTPPPPSEITITKKGKGTGAKRGRKKKIANGV